MFLLQIKILSKNKIQVIISFINYFLNIIFFYYIERHRRSKHEQEGRVFGCDCGKAFLSQPALNNHKKTKHPELLEGLPKRGRGRPRKYPPRTAGDFETTKYDGFFTANNRAPQGGKSIDLKALVEDVFKFLYEGPYKAKLFSQPKEFLDNPILKNLFENSNISTKPKNEKTCDEVFYEYLYTFKDKTNQTFFSLLVKFVLLFRESYDISKTKDVKDEVKKAVTDTISPEGLPDLCNEFYGEFMEPNNFFGIEDQEEKSEIIEIIQHFCIWLFKNEYTKSKLSLAS